MGKVTRVGSASSSLFGFDPQQLVGKSVTTFIDCLAPEPDALEDPLGQSGTGVEAEEDPAETAAMMVALAKRATQQPGMSWRVGVVVPLDPSIDVEALGEIGQSLLSTKKVRPAVMAVAVHVNGMSSTPQRRRA
ncbi:PAS domain-containing protein, partial [Haematococcus lacustris]